MLHFAGLQARLGQGNFHTAAGAVAIFRAGGDVVRIGGGAVTHHLCQGRGTACQGMLQRFKHQHAGALPHHKAIARGIKGARGLLGVVCKARGQGLGCGKATQAHAVDGGLGAAAHGHIGLAATDHPRRIANGLHAGGASRHRRAHRTLEAVADGHMTCRQVDQKRRHGERRQALRPTGIGSAHGLGNGAKAADARGNHGGGARLRPSIRRCPARLGQGLLRSAQGKGNEAVHLALVLGGGCGVRVPPTLGVLGQRGHGARHFGGHAVHHRLRQAAQARYALQQAPPGQFHATAQRRYQPHSSDHHALHFAIHIRHCQSLVFNTARSHAFMIASVIISGSASFAQIHHQKKIP